MTRPAPTNAMRFSLRFTLRDVFWLVLAIATAAGWCVSAAKARTANARLNKELSATTYQLLGCDKELTLMYGFIQSGGGDIELEGIQYRVTAEVAEEP